MRANRVRDAWATGKAVINGWCGIPSSFSAELMAQLGWDSLVVDMQHGHNVGVPRQPGHRQLFAHESRPLVVEPHLEHLDGHHPLKGHLPTAIHRAEPAPADLDPTLEAHRS